MSVSVPGPNCSPQQHKGFLNLRASPGSGQIWSRPSGTTNDEHRCCCCVRLRSGGRSVAYQVRAAWHTGPLHRVRRKGAGRKECILIYEGAHVPSPPTAGQQRVFVPRKAGHLAPPPIPPATTTSQNYPRIDVHNSPGDQLRW
eukprot:356347-Chlamydomonas_euryale.AAC.10